MTQGPGAFEPTDAGGWFWQCADETSVVLPRRDPTFATRQAAEAWLAESYEDLADEGVVTVTLFDGETAVYGPMSLRAAD